MALPIPLPPELVLAKAAGSIPRARALHGGSRYEWKFDGVRAAIARDGDTRMWSRQGTELTAAFPELIAAAAAQLPDGGVFDGEIVAWADGKLDFDVLLRRINVGPSRARALAKQAPVNLVLFDVLALDRVDIRPQPFDVRRQALEEACGQLAPPLSLSPVTEDEEVATGWFTDLIPAGIEGLVVKGGALPYRGGQRDMVKVKHRETVDVIIAAVVGTLRAPEAAVVGLVHDGRLRIAGRTTPLRREQSRALADLVQEPMGEHPWPREVTLGRFSRDRRPVRLTLIEPMMGEVSADTARTDGVFRHLVRFEKARPDLPVPPYSMLER